MSVLELLGGLDWWQLGWLFTGLLLVLLVATLASTRGKAQKGYDAGYHDRQHMESDEMLKAALHSAFEKK